MTAEAEPSRLDLRDPATLIATCFGVGLARWAPGTVASALGAAPRLVAQDLHRARSASPSPPLVLIVIGIWAAGAYERRTGSPRSHRPS